MQRLHIEQTFIANIFYRTLHTLHGVGQCNVTAVGRGESVDVINYTREGG